jgi:hypothetical protein
MSGSSQPRSSTWAAAGDDPRRPAPVELPRPRAPKGAQLVRLRLPDRPGSLAAVTAHLAAHDVDVLGLEVVDRSTRAAVDDLLLSGDGLAAALASLGPRAMVLGRRPGVDLRDPALAMAAACEAVSSARTAEEAHRQILAAALGLVFAEAGLLCVLREGGVLAVAASTVAGLPAAVDGRGPSLITSALFSGEPLTADGRVPWAPPTLRDRLPDGSVGVVPAGSPPTLALALVREDHAPFVPVELERLAALLRVGVATLGLHEATVRRVRLLPEVPKT